MLPVGTRDDVERVLRLLMPDLPESEWPLVFEHGILGPEADDPYTNTPRRARLLRPLSWKRNGFLLLPDALLMRRGAIWRKLAVFPLARLQSIGIEQGPLDRTLSRREHPRAHDLGPRATGGSASSIGMPRSACSRTPRPPRSRRPRATTAIGGRASTR